MRRKTIRGDRKDPNERHFLMFTDSRRRRIKGGGQGMRMMADGRGGVSWERRLIRRLDSSFDSQQQQIFQGGTRYVFDALSNGLAPKLHHQLRLSTKLRKTGVFETRGPGGCN